MRTCVHACVPSMCACVRACVRVGLGVQGRVSEGEVHIDVRVPQRDVAGRDDERGKSALPGEGVYSFSL